MFSLQPAEVVVVSHNRFFVDNLAEGALRCRHFGVGRVASAVAIVLGVIGIIAAVVYYG